MFFLERTGSFQLLAEYDMLVLITISGNKVQTGARTHRTLGHRGVKHLSSMNLGRLNL